MSDKKEELSVRHFCKGCVFTVGDVKIKLKEKYDNLVKHGATEGGSDPVSKKQREIVLKLKEYENRKDNEFIGRTGCGYDLTDQIESIPADGDVYEYECPKCGNIGTAVRTLTETEVEA